MVIVNSKVTAMSVRHAHVGLAAAIVLGMFSGCGGSDGPERAEIHGRVTFNGEPVGAGQIEYRPNVEKGGSGPQSILFIKDGYYESAGKGPVIGPHTVKISGYTGIPVPFKDMGEQLFPTHKDEVEITAGDQEVNYDFPIAGE